MPRAGRTVDRQRWALTAALLALAVLWRSPIAWVVVTSLKPSEHIIRLPPEWIPWPATGAHYHEVLWALALLRSAYSSESYGPIMAGAALSALPLLVVFVVANRRIVEGVRLSGLKG